MKSKGLILLFLTGFIASCTAPAQRLTQSDLEILRPGATSLVVVHSRTGNTAAVGLQISDALHSDYIRLKAPEGSGDNYMNAPNRNKEASVEPKNLDMKKYGIIFLGSPIWYWHANAFIYTFIRNNDFTGKKIVLFYTYEGGISDDAVDEWKSLVHKKGGKVIDVVSINRKDFKTSESLLAEIKSIIVKHKSVWSGSTK